MKSRCSDKRGSALSDDDAMQILNNVSEEYLDHGDTTFATKEELCEAILWLSKEHGKPIDNGSNARAMKALNELLARLKVAYPC